MRFALPVPILTNISYPTLPALDLTRCVYAYFMGVPVADLPFKDLLTHHIYELTPGIVITAMQPER